MTDNLKPNESPTAADDSLLDQLRRANPIADADAGVDWNEADNLFARVTSRSAGFEPYTAESTTEVVRRRRPAILVAAAAAVAVLIAAAVTFLPAGGQPALAAVQQAADETAGADSGRVVTDFRIDGSDSDADHVIAGTVTAAFSGADVAVTFDIDPSTDVVSPAEAAEVANAETRLVDGDIYLTTDGERWMTIEAPEAVQRAVVRLTDLRSVLDQVQELVDVTEVGSADIDGESVTHYRSEVDLADESLSESGWMPGTDAVPGATPDIEAEGLVIVDLYVDDDGLMRRVEVSGDAKPSDDTIDASATFSIVTDFVDLGSDPAIEAPDPDSVETFGFDQDPFGSNDY